MKKTALIVTFFLAASLLFTGCANSMDSPPGFDSFSGGSPRLIIRGKVCNEQGEGLPGIHVREEKFTLDNGIAIILDEPDIVSYNYAYTDANGNYTFVRYRGREMPAEVLVAATDTNGVYQNKALWAEVVYDFVNTPDGPQAYNGYVYADFVLEKKE